MRKIVQYTIVVTREVNDYIKDGWQPFGSPFIDSVTAHQAMVKYEDDPEDLVQPIYVMPGPSDEELKKSLDNLTIRKKES